jgi:hypothetical protein
MRVHGRNRLVETPLLQQRSGRSSLYPVLLLVSGPNSQYPCVSSTAGSFRVLVRLVRSGDLLADLDDLQTQQTRHFSEHVCLVSCSKRAATRRVLLAPDVYELGGRQRKPRRLLVWPILKVGPGGTHLSIRRGALESGKPVPVSFQPDPEHIRPRPRVLRRVHKKPLFIKGYHGYECRQPSSAERVVGRT